MRNEFYLIAKAEIKKLAKNLKSGINDKPLIRQTLNDHCDTLCRDFNFMAMKEQISEKQAKLYSNWLASFTADCHPND